MRHIMNNLTLTSLLALGVGTSLRAADAEPAAPKEISTFTKINIARKLVGIGLDVKSAQDDANEARGELEDTFTLPKDKIDEAKQKKLIKTLTEATRDGLKSLEDMISLLNEFATADILKSLEDTEEEEKAEEAKKSDVQIPASFSPDKIKRIRDMKAKNQIERDRVDSGVKLNTKKTFAHMMSLKKEEQAALIAKIDTAMQKNIELDVQEYREMYSFLTPDEMNLFFKLQRQVMVEKKKIAEEKRKVREKAKEAKKAAEEKEKEKEKAESTKANP